MRDVKKIYIHCSYHPYGDFYQINDWHRIANFDSWQCSVRERKCYFGYHYLVMNQYENVSVYKENKFTSITDGKIIQGRPISIKGAHVRGHNSISIGICYVGVTPTPLQLESLYSLCIKYMNEFDLSVDDVLGHYEYYLNVDQPVSKTCPNFDMDAFRYGLKIRVLNSGGSE